MSCALTQDYVLDCRNSVGGSREFYVCPFDDVTAMTVVAGVVTVLTKAASKKFYHYAQIKQTAEADESLNGNEENGTVHAVQTVKMVLNKRQTTVRDEIMLLAQNRLLIVEVDQNGNAWMYGYKNGMLLKKGAAKSGKGMGDRNGYELDFEGMEPELAYNVLGSVVSALTTPGT